MAVKPSTRNRARGTTRQIKGKAKEMAGRVTRSQRLKVEGKVQAAAGRAQRKLGEAERDFEKDMDKDIE